MSRRRRAGVLGSFVGVAAAGAAVGLAVQRLAMSRKVVVEDPFAGEPFGLLPSDEERRVEGTSGVSLHVEVVEPQGVTPDLTVIFVHGFCLDLGTWHFQRRSLSGLARPRLRMVFYDQPGHGRSGRKPAGDYGLDDLGADLGAVVDQVAASGPLVLIGHSMGGMTIMALAEARPELFTDRVVGVGLISTSAGDLDAVALGMPDIAARIRKSLTPALAAVIRARPALLEKGRTSGRDLTYLLTRRYGFGRAGVSAALVRYVEQMNAATSLEVIAGYLRTLSDHERYAALEVLDGIETLVICGDSDLLTPPAHTEEIARLLPGAELVVIADGGHVALMEYAEIVNSHLVGFLERAARSVPGREPPQTPRRRRARAERQELAEAAGPVERGRMQRVRKAKSS
jgi:pimeloyl-ACP methyl ester carboxylesterase